MQSVRAIVSELLLLSQPKKRDTIEAARCSRALVREKVTDRGNQIMPASVSALLLGLKNYHTTVCHSAAEALGSIRDERSILPLCEILGSTDRSLHNVAVEALGKMGPPAIGPLSQALAGSRASVRRSAAEALGNIGGVRVVEPL